MVVVQNLIQSQRKMKENAMFTRKQVLMTDLDSALTIDDEEGDDYFDEESNMQTAVSSLITSVVTDRSCKTFINYQKMS